jgi:hypothetical protein
MPRPSPNQPDPGSWPSCDQEQPGISIRPLRHGDLQALLAHLDRQDERLLTEARGRRRTADEPVVTVRVRASVGRPGASAQDEYRRRRATEMAGWMRGLLWRVGPVLTPC